MENNFSIIRNVFNALDFIKTAIVYGTNAKEINPDNDLDIAVVLEEASVIPAETFQKLFHIRKKLQEFYKVDIDLVPHTLDELEKNTISPLTYPHNSPALAFGIPLKGELPNIYKLIDVNHKVSNADLLKFHLSLDRATIRRFACKKCTPKEKQVFLNKLSSIPQTIINIQALISNTSLIEVDAGNIVEKYIMLKSHLGEESTPHIDLATKLISHGEDIINGNPMLKMRLAESLENICSFSLFKTSLTKQIAQGNSRE